MTPDLIKSRFIKSVLFGLGCAAAVCQSASAAPALASLPLYFEANQGQADKAARFVARGQDAKFLISPVAVQLDLFKTTGMDAISAKTVRMQLVGGSSQAQISGADELPGKINYLIGGDSSKWKTGVATFAKIRVEEVYPGVSLTYYGNHRHLEYDFTIAPDANPGIIAIRFDGADTISISPAGELVLRMGNDEIRQPRPDIYQMVQGLRRKIVGGYKILDAHTVAFDVGDYDRSQTLVIDPILSYSTYFGGLADDVAWNTVVDTNGFVYVAGETLSAKLATVGAVQTNYGGGIWTGDAFVAKFSNNGSNLIFCTYLGGNQEDFAYGLAVDNAGDVFLTGATDSPDFPTNNALYPTIPGHAYHSPRTGTFYNPSAFVAEIDPTGSHLIYSTYFGGSGNILQGTGDEGAGIALDSAGNAYVTGFTSSTNFPATNSLIYQLCGTNHTFNRLAGSQNAFLAKIGPGGTNLIYSTYFGGTNVDGSTGIAVDGAGCVYIAGITDSTNFPTTTNAFQPLYGGLTNPAVAVNNTFVAKFAPSGTNLIYSTLLGGTNDDQAFGIAVDAAGNAYVTGAATSPDFPNTVTNLAILGKSLTNNSTYGYAVTTNAFLTQITWNGTNAAIGYSMIFGGTNLDIDAGYGVAVDPAGNVFVCGASSSTSFPVTTNNIPDITGCLRATNSGGFDAFVIAFSPNAGSVLYSGYLGGVGDDFGNGIAVDPMGDAYIVGSTGSANFPTNNARQAALNGTTDAFLAKIVLDNVPPLLSLSANSGSVQVTWNSGLPFEPELQGLFKLESSTNLVSTNWTLVPQLPALLNKRYAVTLNPANEAEFFRLQAVRP